MTTSMSHNTISSANSTTARGQPPLVAGDTSARAADRAANRVRLQLRRHPYDRQLFQVCLIRPQRWPLRGTLQQHQHVSLDVVTQLQRSYEQHMRIMRELTEDGMPVAPPDQSQLLKLGRAVGQMLPPAIRREISRTALRALQRQRPLRVILEVAHDAHELLCIPWELLALPLGWRAHDDDEDAFLFLNGTITLARQVHGVGRAAAPVLPGPLRVEVFAATPQHSETICLDETLATMIQLQRTRAAEIGWYDGPATLDALQQRLRESNPQIVHLLCHGQRSDTGGGRRYSLRLSDADGYAQAVSANHLAQVLTLAPNLELVVLQACHAGATNLRSSAADRAGHRVIDSIALTLIRCGVPAVIAMQGEVTQRAASAFVRACYGMLAQGVSLDRAVAAGRIAMEIADAGVDWSLPVLYQGSDQPDEPPWPAQLSRWLGQLLGR